jgi:hypothetical protein
MKQYRWSVHFPSGTSTLSVDVNAGCEQAAKILARAAMIKSGLPWRKIKSIIKMEK